MNIKLRRKGVFNKWHITYPADLCEWVRELEMDSAEHCGHLDESGAIYLPKDDRKTIPLEHICSRCLARARGMARNQAKRQKAIENQN